MNKIKINFSNEKVIKDSNSIFLAGPTNRNSTFNTSWRKDAVRILNEKGYSGVVYIPEYPNDIKFDESNIQKQTYWEWEALDSAGVIVFWIPRKLPEMPAFTTNIEFGRYITKKPNQIVLGYPNNAEKMRYIELLYNKETNMNSYRTLEETLKYAIKILKDKEK